MKNLIELLKTMLLGGLFVLLPVLLLYLILSEMVGLIIALGTPIADTLLPEGTIQDNTPFKGVWAVLLILALSLVLGLAMRSASMRRVGHAVETKVLGRLPVYKALSMLVRGFSGEKDTDAFRAAILTGPGDIRELVYVVEDTGGPDVTVLRPRAPAGFAGPVGIVPRDKLEMLDASIGDVSRVLAHWGVGTQELLETRDSSG